MSVVNWTTFEQFEEIRELKWNNISDLTNKREKLLYQVTLTFGLCSILG